MSDLKNKIFFLLISIFTIFLFSIISVFNISIYNKEYNDLNSKMFIISSTKEKMKFGKNEFNPIFMENEVYEVVFNRFGNIEKIVSYSPSGLTDLEIEKLINSNLNRINSKSPNFLYIDDYVFVISRDGNLLIVNNQNTKTYLIHELIKSIIIFILLEIIIVFSSIKITKWIVEPVKDAFKKQKQFISDASHELKTPIAIISASAETLEQNPKDKKWLENIKDENERMSRLVSNLLELSKTENIKENEIYSNVDLSKLIRKKTLTFESLIFENNLELANIIEENIMFNCSPDRMKELLSILIDNAIKHSEENSKIEVKLKKYKNNIVLFVKNKGEAIPKEEREKIFERFYRVDKSRNRNESRYGLGLSIAKNIVNNHNGDIKVDCLDGYTTFIVTFKQN